MITPVFPMSNGAEAFQTIIEKKAWEVHLLTQE